MAQDATIISATLDTKELQKSIDEMVTKFDQGLQNMLDHTNRKVTEINNALKQISNATFDSKGSKDGVVGNTSKQVKEQDEVTKAVERTIAAKKEEKATYDQTAQAMHKAFATQQSKRYDVSDIQSLRMRQHELEAQIASTEKAQKNNASYQEALENTKRQFMQLSQLRSEYESKQGINQREVRDLQHITHEYERVKKVLDELVNFKSGGFNVLNDQTAKLEKLRAEYNSVLSKIKEIGQSLIDNDFMQKIAAQNAEQGLRSQARAYDDLLRRIEQIKSAKEAKNAYTSISLMNIDSLETAQQKIEAIQALLNKVNRTPLLSKSNIKDLENALASAKLQLRSYEGQTEKSAEANAKLAAYVKQSAERERQRRAEIQRTGAAAQESANKIIRSMYEQMASGSGKQVPVDQIYELLNLFKQMNSAYYSEGVGRESPIYKSLMKDLNAIREVIKEVSKYNNAIFKDNLSGSVGVTQRSTVESLRKEISSLTSEYNKMTIAQINAGKADDLIKNFQNANRAAQVLQRTLSRPIDLKSAMGLKAGTLDEIAYKMQMLSAYRENLNIFDPKQKSEIEQVNAALKDLEKTQREIMGENESMLKSNNALARSFNYMKNRLAFYFTVGTATQFVKQLRDIRSQYEMNERALGILIDSAEKGSQIFNELSQMSLVSPYTLIELTNAAKQLTAYGVAARDVVDTTRRLADIAAAVGAPIERISYALGHIQTYGYLTSLQARQFANSGIPLVKELAARYSELEGRVITTADVYDRMKKKQVEYADVLDVINRMTDEGGKFFDFQAKMADTLKVRLANLNLAWNNMLNDMGKSTQGLMTLTIGSLRTLFTHWKQLDQAIKSAAWAGGLIVAVRALNVLLVKARANFGILSASMTATQIAGKGLASTLGNVIGGFKALVTTPLTWWSLLAFAIVDAWRNLRNLNEEQKEFNKSLRDAGNNNTKSLTDFYNQYNGGKKKISADDAEKVWEEMREQIELTVKKSDEFVGSLLKIDDVSKRLKVGFELINDINEVNAALKELDDDSIKMEADFSKWWNLNLWPDGLVENIKNYTKAQKELYEYSMKGESLSKMEEDAKELEEKFLDLQGAISITTGSIDDLIKLKGWEGNINKINALYDQVFGNLAEKYNLSPSEAFNMQMAAEKGRSIATERALKIRIADERDALKVATDETTRYAITQRLGELEQEFFFFVKNTDKSRVYWRDFTNWIKTNHLSETQAMFKGMDAQQIRSLDFEKGKYFEWVDTLAKQYAKEHKMSYTETFDMLRNYITSANQMSIFIPLVIGSENKKSVYQTLTEADQAADTAWQKIERLNTRIAELSKNKASNTEQLADAQAELTQAYQDYNDAIAKGGHSKKETTKAAKDQKAAESELQKALKEEIQLLDKARSVYKQLTKEGVESNRALTISTEGYEDTITHINSVLQKYGIPKFNLASYAGVESPRAILDLLQSQLEALVRSGAAKPEEIKDLQVKLKDIKVDSVSFDQKKLTNSLNNELGKLKDEYELAVELDANPELGDMFTSMFGIDKSELSSNIEDYMRTAQAKFDELVNEKNWSIGLNIFKASNEDWTNWANTIGLSQEALKELSKEFVSARDFALKYFEDIINKSKDLEYKFADTNGKIALKEEELANLRVRLSNETSEIVRNNIRLQIRETEEEIAKIKEELYELLPIYQKVFGSVAEHSNMIQRRLANNLLNALKEAEKNGKNSRGNYTFIDPETGEKAELTAKKLGNEIKRINEELRKSQSNLDKFVEALTKGEDGVVDIPKAFELANAELGNMSGLVNSMKKMSEVLGTDQETLDMLDEIGGVIDGIGEAFNGISKMASGDIFGGMAGIIGGLASAIGSIFGGAAANNRITHQIEKSEMAVKRLENAYINLNRAVEKAYGTEQYYAKRIAAANKQAQLYEVKRQLQLEKSRSSKYHDEEKIIDLERQVLELGNEIDDMLHEIINDFMGISSVSDAIESMVGSIIESLRSGEDALESFDNSIDDMIANMVKKVFAKKLLGEWFDNVWKAIEQQAENRTQTWVDDLTMLEKLWANRMTDKGEADMLGIQNAENWMSYYSKKYGIEKGPKTTDTYENIKKFIEEQIRKASEYTVGDIRDYAEMLQEGRPIIQGKLDELNELLRQLGLMKDSTQNLSNLQQGIQGITEDTASALEAYMNGVSQQVYLHSDLLTQIKDTLVSWDMDVQLATQAQILLQLQASYQVQMSIQSTLAGWSNASGQAVRVEMI